MQSVLYARACLSVHLSVTRMDLSQTIEVMIMQFTLYSNPMRLVFAG